ncbi:MAG TPA: DUF5668 domain-containing protein [Candidatus Limnocylindrales bacterium]|nr:DUF5668 domain-containing protein [Candidatus Limnocylindrales bacterium]
MTDATPEGAPDPGPDLADRIQERAEAFGREAQAAGDRWAKDPGLVQAANTASRAWGLILIAVGAWFLADVTLGYALPTIAWRDLWPALLVVLGLFIIGRAMTRRA